MTIQIILKYSNNRVFEEYLSSIQIIFSEYLNQVLRIHSNTGQSDFYTIILQA